MKSHHKVSATLVGNVLAEMAVGLKKKEKLEIEKVPFFSWGGGGWCCVCVFGIISNKTHHCFLR